MTSLLQRAGIITAIAVIVLFAFAQFIRRNGMFFPARFPEGAWETTHLPVQPRDLTLSTEDGVRLHAWLFASSQPDAPLMIWLHGNGGNLTHRAEMGARFATKGVSVLLVDWRGYGKSDGKPTEGALYKDALASYDYAKLALKAPRIAVYGESVGGPYAAYVAAHRDVTCVVIENSFPSLRELGNSLYAPLPLGWFAPFAMRTTRWLNDGGKPVLVMHGRRDEVIPFPLGMRLYDGLKVPRQLLVSEYATHSAIPAVEPRYYDTVAGFVRAH
jgi:fermentation-respiration switch protein FrsA (DUF1100 family)